MIWVLDKKELCECYGLDPEFIKDHLDLMLFDAGFRPLYEDSISINAVVNYMFDTYNINDLSNRPFITKNYLELMLDKYAKTAGNAYYNIINRSVNDDLIYVELFI